MAKNIRDSPDRKLVGDVKVGDKISFEVDFLRHLLMECVEDRGDSKVFLYDTWKKRYYKVPNDSELVWWWDWYYHLNCDKYNDVIEDLKL